MQNGGANVLSFFFFLSLFAQAKVFKMSLHYTVRNEQDNKAK